MSFIQLGAFHTNCVYKKLSERKYLHKAVIKSNCYSELETPE